MIEWKIPRDVRGWLSVNEAKTLAELAMDKTVLEIGSFEGRSTIAMAQTAKMVHSVDWHQGDSGTGAADTLTAMWANIKRYGVRDRVILHVGISQDVIPALAGPFDLIFIDGAHDAESVGRDTALALSKATAGTIIAWHDCSDRYPGVRDIVIQTTKGYASLVDSLAWYRY